MAIARKHTSASWVPIRAPSHCGDERLVFQLAGPALRGSRRASHLLRETDHSPAKFDIGFYAVANGAPRDRGHSKTLAGAVGSAAASTLRDESAAMVRLIARPKRLPLKTAPVIHPCYPAPLVSRLVDIAMTRPPGTTSSSSPGPSCRPAYATGHIGSNHRALVLTVSARFLSSSGYQRNQVS